MNENSNRIQLIRMFFLLFWSVAIVGFSCHFGEMLSKQLDEIDVEFCRCPWYLCTIDVQRTLLIAMAHTQRSMIVTGFGNIQCSRDSFKRVINDVDDE